MHAISCNQGIKLVFKNMIQVGTTQNQNRFYRGWRRKWTSNRNKVQILVPVQGFCCPLHLKWYNTTCHDLQFETHAEGITMILKENNSLKNERWGEKPGVEAAVPSWSAQECHLLRRSSRSGQDARSHRTAPVHCSGWDLPRSRLVPHTQESFLPLATFPSPSEMDEHNRGQRLPGRCLEIRLSLSANELWI